MMTSTHIQPKESVFTVAHITVMLDIEITSHAPKDLRHTGGGGMAEI